MAPLFKVCMELCDGAVGFRPSLDVTDENSFLKLLEDLLADIYGCAACIPRLLEGKLSYKVGSQGRVHPCSRRQCLELCHPRSLSWRRRWSSAGCGRR